MTVAASFHLRLSMPSKAPPFFETTIFKKKIAHPMIERPYAVRAPSSVAFPLVPSQGATSNRTVISQLLQVYTIEVRHGGMKWHVTRRYHEFAQLHLRLAELVPESVLPVIPPTKWYCILCCSSWLHTLTTLCTSLMFVLCGRLGTLDESFLLERVLSLHNYLKGVLMIDSVHTSVPLLSFLGGSKLLVILEFCQCLFQHLTCCPCGM